MNCLKRYNPGPAIERCYWIGWFRVSLMLIFSSWYTVCSHIFVLILLIDYTIHYQKIEFTAESFDSGAIHNNNSRNPQASTWWQYTTICSVILACLLMTNQRISNCCEKLGVKSCVERAKKWLWNVGWAFTYNHSGLWRQECNAQLTKYCDRLSMQILLQIIMNRHHSDETQLWLLRTKVYYLLR